MLEGLLEIGMNSIVLRGGRGEWGMCKVKNLINGHFIICLKKMVQKCFISLFVADSLGNYLIDWLYIYLILELKRAHPN